MDVGFMIRWPKAGTVNNFPVVGEELYATSLTPLAGLSKLLAFRP